MFSFKVCIVEDRPSHLTPVQQNRHLDVIPYSDISKVPQQNLVGHVNNIYDQQKGIRNHY